MAIFMLQTKYKILSNISLNMQLKITCTGLNYNRKQPFATVLRKYIPDVDKYTKASGFIVFIPGINDDHNRIPFDYNVWRIV